MDSSSEDETITTCAAAFLLHQLISRPTNENNEVKVKSKRKKRRRYWISPMYQERQFQAGTTDGMLSDVKFKVNPETGHLSNFVRMTSVDYENLLMLIGPKILKRDTHLRKAVSVNERLVLTLRFLATGESYTSLQNLFKISKQLISRIVPEVCQAITECLSEAVQLPKSTEEWLTIAQQFEDTWNFPHCIGAIDGKHIIVQKPKLDESDSVHNHSIVLFGLVDGDYNFLYADVGTQGSTSDDVFSRSKLRQLVVQDTVKRPSEQPLRNRTFKVPYFFVASSAFSLQDTLMTPYQVIRSQKLPERVFNYRLNRARRVVHNTFGMISSIFKVLRKPLLLEPEKAQAIVLAIVHLHNFLNKSESSKHTYMTPLLINKDDDLPEIGNWRANPPTQSFLPIAVKLRVSTHRGKEIRNELTDYFVNEDEIPSQSKMCLDNVW